MLGTWTLNDEDERDSLAYLIRCLPADGRYEVEVREAANRTPTNMVVAESEELVRRLKERGLSVWTKP